MKSSSESLSLKTKYFLLAVALPLAFFAFKFGESFFTTARDDRAPASASVDLSHLSGEEFVVAAKLKMLEGLEVVSQDGRHLVTMGHFTGTDDTKASACQTYSRVEYEFAADDSVVSGEPTLMKVSGLCSVGSDPQKLRALEIPYSRILSEKPTDRNFSFSDRDKVEIEFINVGDEWPRSWRLRSARYDGSSTLKLDAKEIYNYRGRSLQIRWP